MAVRHKSKLFLSVKWLSRTSRPLGLLFPFSRIYRDWDTFQIYHLNMPAIPVRLWWVTWLRLLWNPNGLRDFRMWCMTFDIGWPVQVKHRLMQPLKSCISQTGPSGVQVNIQHYYEISYLSFENIGSWKHATVTQLYNTLCLGLLKVTISSYQYCKNCHTWQM